MHFQHILEDEASIGVSFRGFCAAKMWCFFFPEAYSNNKLTTTFPICACPIFFSSTVQNAEQFSSNNFLQPEKGLEVLRTGQRAVALPTHTSPPSCCPCSRNHSGTTLRLGLAQHFHYSNGFSIAPLGLERACSVPDL